MKSAIFGKGAAPSVSATTYIALSSQYGSAAQTSDAFASQPTPTDGALSKFYIELTNPPGVGTSWTFTLFKNGAATSAILTIADTATSASFPDSVTFVAGDRFTWQCVPTATPATAGVTAWAMDCDTSGNTQPLLTGSGSAAASTTVNNYMTPQASTGGLGTTRPVPIPTAGTISDLYIHGSVAPGTAKTYTITLVVNEVDSALTYAFTGTGTTGSLTGTSVSVNPGDTAYWKIVPSGTPAASRLHISALFTPTIPGESIQTMNNPDTTATTSTNYSSVVGGGSLAWAASESSRANRQNGTLYALKKLYVVLGTAPGVGASYTASIRARSTVSGVTFSIADAATTGNSGVTDGFNGITTLSGGNISVLLTAVNTPAATTAATGFVMYYKNFGSGFFRLGM